MSRDIDWTVDPLTHCYNSSPLFKYLEKEIAKIIHDSARDLINGRVELVGGLILAELTHKYGLVPSKSLGELLANTNKPVVEVSEPVHPSCFKTDNPPEAS